MSCGIAVEGKEPRMGPFQGSQGVAPRGDGEIEIALLTGGFDRPYAFGIATALAGRGVHLDVLGSAEVDSPELHSIPTLRFHELYWDPRKKASTTGRIWRVLLFYLRLLRYTLIAKPKIFHILWNNKAELFDRTLLMLYYKVIGKKVVLTAHNVNAGKRDANDSLLNRSSLKIQYRLSDHIFVHTEKMRGELIGTFGVREQAVTVIPFGINNSVPNTTLTPAEAKRQLGIELSAKTILFFGAIRPYKGLEYLIDAFQRITDTDEYRLIIAGEGKRGSEKYLKDIQATIASHTSRDSIIQRIEFVRDEETELYFKASDVLALPYTEVFQSGVLFLAYSFGLPVVATDVGGFPDDIVEGETGYVCRSRDAAALSEALKIYFGSDLFKSLPERRKEIQQHAAKRNSWEVVSGSTHRVYADLLRS